MSGEKRCLEGWAGVCGLETRFVAAQQEAGGRATFYRREASCFFSSGFARLRFGGFVGFVPVKQFGSLFVGVTL